MYISIAKSIEKPVFTNLEVIRGHASVEFNMEFSHPLQLK